MDLMIDIETLGLTPGSVIWEIAALAFDPLGSGFPDRPSFCVAIDPVDAQRQGLSVDAETVLWWMEQPDTSRLRHATTPLQIALADFRRFFLELAPVCVWSWGAAFDFPILAAAYRLCGYHTSAAYSLCGHRPILWDHRQVRDARTIAAAAGASLSLKDYSMPGEARHSALDDCRAACRAVQLAFASLRAGNAPSSQAELPAAGLPETTPAA